MEKLVQTTFDDVIYIYLTETPFNQILFSNLLHFKTSPVKEDFGKVYVYFQLSFFYYIKHALYSFYSNTSTKEHVHYANV